MIHHVVVKERELRGLTIYSVGEHLTRIIGMMEL